MKSRYATSLCVMGVALFWATHIGAEEFSALVTTEVQKEYTELQRTYSKARRALVELDSTKKKVITESQVLSKLQLVGLEHLRKYITLLQTRYVNDNGEYQAALVIGPNDVEHINKLLDGYLHASPLTGKISAGHAERLLLWGIFRLDEISKMNADPTDKNNPELEIISKKLVEADSKIKTAELLAGRLGVTLSKTDDFSDGLPESAGLAPSVDPNKKQDPARRLPAYSNPPAKKP